MLQLEQLFIDVKSFAQYSPASKSLSRDLKKKFLTSHHGLFTLWIFYAYTRKLKFKNRILNDLKE